MARTSDTRAQCASSAASAGQRWSLLLLLLLGALWACAASASAAGASPSSAPLGFPLPPVPVLPAGNGMQSTFEYHLVSFRFVNASPEVQQQIAAMYRALLTQCPYIVDMVGGVPNSREGHQQQMEQAWVTVFRNVADRDYFVGRPLTYPYDPFHDAFKAFVGPYLRQPIEQGLIVIDFQNVPYQAHALQLAAPQMAVAQPPQPSQLQQLRVAPTPTVNNDTLQYHFVSFRFTNATTPAIVAQIAAKYQALLSQCPYIVSLVGGVPNSREGFQQQMDQAWLLAFRSTADRDYFVGRPLTSPYDPYHDAFKAFVGPYLREPIEQGLIVLDFVNEPVHVYAEPFSMHAWSWIDFAFPDSAAHDAYYTSQAYKHVLLSGVKVWLDPRTNTSVEFVSLPRLKSGVPATLGVIDRLAVGVGNVSLVASPSRGPLIQPYPSWQLNALGDPTAIQSVLGFELDSDNSRLYILDQGRVGSAPALAGSIKLLIWDLLRNEEIQRFVFPPEMCNPQTSYLNDIVVDSANGFAYISDTGTPLSGQKSDFDPALIVYSYARNTAWRVLSKHSSVMPDFNFTFSINGTAIYPGKPMMAGVNGIALTPDARWLFWCPLSSLALYRLPTCLLQASDPAAADGVSAQELAASVQLVMQRPGNADGLAFSDEALGPLITPPDAAADAHCSVDALSASSQYTLIATDLAHSTVWSIQGNLAYTVAQPLSADLPADTPTSMPRWLAATAPLQVSPLLLNITAIRRPTSVQDGSMEWPNAIGFDHRGSLVWTISNVQHFGGLADMDFSALNFRVWAAFLGVDGYLGATSATPDVKPADDAGEPAGHSWLFWLLVVGGSCAALLLLLGLLRACCTRSSNRDLEQGLIMGRDDSHQHRFRAIE